MALRRGSPTHVLAFDAGCEKKRWIQGSSRGRASLAALIFSREDDLEPIYTRTLIPNRRMTNNEAEYQALILGLRLAVEKKLPRLVVVGDSKLVIMQVTGRWRIKSPRMGFLVKEVRRLQRLFDQIRFRWLRRSTYLPRMADQAGRDALEKYRSDRERYGFKSDAILQLSKS